MSEARELNGLSLPSGGGGDLWRVARDHGKHGEEEQRKEGRTTYPIPQLPYSEQNWRLTLRIEREGEGGLGH